MNDTSFISWEVIMPYKQSEKTEAKKDEKKNLIFETAASVFAQKGYHQTSVKDITEEAGISVGTFYLYFMNKEDLFEKLYDEMKNKLNTINNYAKNKPVDTVAQRFINIMTASIWAFQKYSELSRILLIEAVGLNPRFEEKYAEIMVNSCRNMEETFNELKRQGYIDVPNTKVAAIAHEGAFTHAITFWLRTENQSDLREYTYPLVIFVLQGIKMDTQNENIQNCIKKMFEELDNKENELLDNNK